jgi:UrcA family protein
MTRFMIIAAAGGLFASAASATPNVYLRDSSVHIRYGDLDLRSLSGRSTLENRLRQGADLLCADANDGRLASSLPHSHCFRIAIASGRAQMSALTGR